MVPPAYATPLTILSRLSQSSREGFPSLPYLIDQPRAFASLVMMWDNYSDNLPQNQTVQLFHYEGFYDFGYNLLLE